MGKLSPKRRAVFLTLFALLFFGGLAMLLWSFLQPKKPMKLRLPGREYLRTTNPSRRNSLHYTFEWSVEGSTSNVSEGADSRGQFIETSDPAVEFVNGTAKYGMAFAGKLSGTLTMLNEGNLIHDLIWSSLTNDPVVRDRSDYLQVDSVAKVDVIYKGVRGTESNSLLNPEAMNMVVINATVTQTLNPSGVARYSFEYRVHLNRTYEATILKTTGTNSQGQTTWVRRPGTQTLVGNRQRVYTVTNDGNRCLFHFGLVPNGHINVQAAMAVLIEENVKGMSSTLDIPASIHLQRPFEMELGPVGAFDPNIVDLQASVETLFGKELTVVVENTSGANVYSFTVNSDTPWASSIERMFTISFTNQYLGETFSVGKYVTIRNGQIDTSRLRYAVGDQVTPPYNVTVNSFKRVVPLKFYLEGDTGNPHLQQFGSVTDFLVTDSTENPSPSLGMNIVNGTDGETYLSFNRGPQASDSGTSAVSKTFRVTVRYNINYLFNVFVNASMPPTEVGSTTSSTSEYFIGENVAATASIPLNTGGWGFTPELVGHTTVATAYMDVEGIWDDQLINVNIFAGLVGVASMSLNPIRHPSSTQSALRHIVRLDFANVNDASEVRKLEVIIYTIRTGEENASLIQTTSAASLSHYYFTGALALGFSLTAQDAYVETSLNQTLRKSKLSVDPAEILEDAYMALGGVTDAFPAYGLTGTAIFGASTEALQCRADSRQNYLGRKFLYFTMVGTLRDPSGLKQPVPGTSVKLVASVKLRPVGPSYQPELFGANYALTHVAGGLSTRANVPKYADYRIEPDDTLREVMRVEDGYSGTVINDDLTVQLLDEPLWRSGSFTVFELTFGSGTLESVPLETYTLTNGKYELQRDTYALSSDFTLDGSGAAERSWPVAAFGDELPPDRVAVKLSTTGQNLFTASYASRGVDNIGTYRIWALTETPSDVSDKATVSVNTLTGDMQVVPATPLTGNMSDPYRVTVYSSLYARSSAEEDTLLAVHAQDVEIRLLHTLDFSTTLNTTEGAGTSWPQGNITITPEGADEGSVISIQTTVEVNNNLVEYSFWPSPPRMTIRGVQTLDAGSHTVSRTLRTGSGITYPLPSLVINVQSSSDINFSYPAAASRLFANVTNVVTPTLESDLVHGRTFGITSDVAANWSINPLSGEIVIPPSEVTVNNFVSPVSVAVQALLYGSPEVTVNVPVRTAIPLWYDTSEANYRIPKGPSGALVSLTLHTRAGGHSVSIDDTLLPSGFRVMPTGTAGTMVLTGNIETPDDEAGSTAVVVPAFAILALSGGRLFANEQVTLTLSVYENAPSIDAVEYPPVTYIRSNGPFRVNLSAFETDAPNDVNFVFRRVPPVPRTQGRLEIDSRTGAISGTFQIRGVYQIGVLAILATTEMEAVARFDVRAPLVFSVSKAVLRVGVEIDPDKEGVEKLRVEYDDDEGIGKDTVGYAVGLPEGLEFRGGTFLDIVGTPLALGSFEVRLTVVDDDGIVGEVPPFFIEVVSTLPPGPPPPAATIVIGAPGTGGDPVSGPPPESNPISTVPSEHITTVDRNRGATRDGVRYGGVGAMAAATTVVAVMGALRYF